MSEFKSLVSTLQCQFLSCYTLSGIRWQDIPKDLSWEQQKLLLDSTSGHALNQTHPIKLSYQLNFLKRLMQTLEANSPEVHDSLYETYCALQQRVPHDATEKYAYKHYLLPMQDTHLTLRESKSFVAEGTTGLCSWQASVALADFLLHNPDIINGQNVLELGAGTGLCGLIAARCCRVKQMLLTDGSMECVKLMRENILRNFSSALEVSHGHFQLDHQTLGVCQLSWDAIGSVEVKPNVLLAADVVYDDLVFNDLTATIDWIFTTMDNNIQMLLAATVRNEHTLRKFLNLLYALHFGVEESTVIPLENSYLYWDRTTPVKIFTITRGSSVLPQQ